ncbi:DUF4476 domain-containing protein [Chitinophaga cymbidii]|uniref:DUF4476 domain-containing protein n=1 Tax=Chitinophaga cymbidii TaxID=1096750 RepID=A0A512RJN0_9BACT|nr:DUF4476 domain-containing protein [Chitinophaga cymbidii]GEP95919.1 hypothetical protein CCY01nite_21790 [Chitinophaga cymbidii]
MYRSKLKLLYLFFALLLAGRLSAQDPSYFVYIQHEKHQPFYVKLNGKVISSSAKGYVILPKLSKGKVPVTIGFLKNELPEQEYTLRITGQRDYGYLLKNTQDKEFALYDLQTFATLMPAGAGASFAAPAAEGEVSVTRISDDTASAETKEMMDNVQADVQAALAKATTDTAPPAAPVKKSSFAEALDKVVKDDRPDDMPLELAKPVTKPAEQPVIETVASVDTPATDEPVKKRNKRKERKERAALTEEEKALLSSVMEDEKQAAAEEALKEAAAEEVAVAEPVEEAVPDPAPAPKKEKKAKKKKDQPEPEFIDFGETGAAAAAASTEKPAEIVAESIPEISAKEAREAKREKRRVEREAAERAAFVRDSIANSEFASVPEEAERKRVKMVNSDCQKVLETDDFRKLLRTMNSRKTDEDMVDAFRRGTRSVCVSSEQVRALALLISTEENRYQLLDAAYPRTYDSQNFSGLGDLLKDDYYKGRFKAMVKK